MNELYATEILGWRYSKPYDFYNNELTKEALEEMLDGTYYAVINNDNELVGFFCTGKSAQVPAGNQVRAYRDNYLDIGLGMKPHLTGKGNGFEFCSYVLLYLQEKYGITPYRVTVANFNKRAIYLYEKLGFVKENEFRSPRCEFITMVKR